LYVRFAAPQGMHVTFYQGKAPPRRFAAPVVVGLRPGYAYRVKLTDLPEHPGLALFPSLEVYGTLQLPPHLLGPTYPAPFPLAEIDVERVAASSMLTKVIYLEDPEKAAPTATRLDEPPLETDLPAGSDPWVEARALGRPLVVLRLGGRQLNDEELKAQTVSGTILFPDERSLAAPAAPPWIPWACVPYYDPRLGPKPPTEECLKDGGNAGMRAGLDRNGQLQGLGPADTVAEYTDSLGQRRLAVSNCVCICVPRFAVLRKEVPLAGYESAFAPIRVETAQGQALVQANLPSRVSVQNEQLQGLLGRERPTGAVNSLGVDRVTHVEVLQGYYLNLGAAAALCTKAAVQITEVERTRLLRQVELAESLSRPIGVRALEQREGTVVVGKLQGLQVISGVATTRECVATCNEVPEVPAKPLCLHKWANVEAAQVGDVVTFYLKYSNQGGQPIQDVVVSDSLTGRLEYVPGSAKSDRTAVFTTQPNQAGSLLLRWEFSGSLPPGQSGAVSFQARVR
jgi:uncharacterized repeat protein (TIGR01451 family)